MSHHPGKSSATVWTSSSVILLSVGYHVLMDSNIIHHRRTVWLTLLCLLEGDPSACPAAGPGEALQRRRLNHPEAYRWYRWYIHLYYLNMMEYNLCHLYSVCVCSSPQWFKTHSVMIRAPPALNPSSIKMNWTPSWGTWVRLSYMSITQMWCEYNCAYQTQDGCSLVIDKEWWWNEE